MAEASDELWGRIALTTAAFGGAAGVAVFYRFDALRSTENLFPAIALLVAAMGAGTLAMAFRSRAAIISCAILTGASAAMAVQIGTAVGYALTMFALAHGAFIAVLLRRAQNLSQPASDNLAETARQQEFLALMLGDWKDAPGGWYFETDANGLITHSSAGLEAAIGKSPDGVVGVPLSGLFNPGESAAGWDRLVLGIAAHQTLDCAVELPWGASRLWWQVSCRPLHGTDGTYRGHRGIARNITGERNARRQLAEETERLRRGASGTLELLAETVQCVRPQLDTVLGFAEILLSPAAADFTQGQRDAHLQTLLNGGRDLAAHLALVNDMIRLDRGSLRLVEHEIDAAELTEIAVKLCRTAAEGADVVIVVEVFDGVELRCDARRIRQVAVSLVIRAIQASRRGETVRVICERTASGGLAIAIHDTGRELTEHEIERAFEPGPSTGMADLALPIATRIALLHGGDVTIASTRGAGTTARLTLPACRVTWLPAHKPLDIRAA